VLILFRFTLIENSSISKRSNDLYLEKGLTAAEIAMNYGTVKSVILSILHRMEVLLRSPGGRLLNDPNASTGGFSSRSLLSQSSTKSHFGLPLPSRNPRTL